MVLGIYGAGGLGRETLELARDIGAAKCGFADTFFIVDGESPKAVNGAEVLPPERFFRRFGPESARIVIAVGEPAARTQLRERIQSAGYRLATLIHPSAKVGAGVRLGEGTVVSYGCFVSCNVRTGLNVCIQPLASVGHDTVIGDDCVVSSHVSLAGACSVGFQTYIGMNVPVREHVRVGAQTIVGMGAVVQRDIPDGVVALGNPARVIKSNESHRVFK